MIGDQSLQENRIIQYKNVEEELQNRLDISNHPIANTSNFIGILKQQFNWLWIGFYFYLMLGNFQGPPACTKIFKEQGVCGKVWSQLKTIIVPDTHKFQGHIECSSKSNSQIAIPILQNGQFIGLLDIDSQKFNQFSQIDQKKLKNLIQILSKAKQWKFFILAMQQQLTK